ncbi:hypothetical protein SAMN05421509_103296 [Chromohalobacter canadensis]|uniref:Uncharacterized protein n=1 Tax=Chromohalobacter canadensis TaxID=141389 RepID=A0A285VL78_9GAMM|nr:hypothetical protein SAMN05421509_103296 [Chromohalobacter canadensis]
MHVLYEQCFSASSSWKGKESLLTKGGELMGRSWLIPLDTNIALGGGQWAAFLRWGLLGVCQRKIYAYRSMLNILGICLTYLGADCSFERR